MRQGSRGLLLSSSSLCGAGRSAAYSRSGAAFVRAAEHCHDVHETASFNHISIVFCVMKVADRLNSDLFSSVSALQITVLFDHRRSHHHHFLCVFRIPFQLTWTHKVRASIPGHVGSLNTIPPHHTLSASCFCVPRAGAASHSHLLRVFLCLPFAATSLF